MIVEPPSFAHLASMSDGIGTFEHALLSAPRTSGGYCTDDMARLMIVTALDPEPTPISTELGHLAFRFVADAQAMSGRVHNRREPGGRWSDRRSADDCWGRSVWGLATVVAHTTDAAVRQSAMTHFDRSVQPRSRHRRAMVFAGLGAAEVLAANPRHDGARRLLADAVTAIGLPGVEPAWPWPEARLTYSNASLCETLIAAGELLERPAVLADGLELLGWLLDRETAGDHLSPTGVDGAGRDDVGPSFDQQPIEVAAMATACGRALRVTGDAAWRVGVERSMGWFFGANDVGAVMCDLRTGACYDGLEPDGVNLNQGTESTLALIATTQVARRLSSVAC
jgi:hypothetical protein